MCRNDIMPMNLIGNISNWCKTIKYLGVYLQSSRCVKFSINNSTNKAFYAVCNSVWSYNDTLLLHLHETYSLSVIMYAIPALLLTTRQMNELNACWNTGIMLYVDCLATTNGRVSVHYYYYLKD